MITLAYSVGAKIYQGWLATDDYSVTTRIVIRSLSGTGTGTLLSKDITYSTNSTASVITEYAIDVLTSLNNPQITFTSLTPAVCSVNTLGQTTHIADGQCTVKLLGKTGERQVSGTVSAGVGTAITGIMSYTAGSLRKYLYDQQIAALSGVTAGATAQRAFVDGLTGAYNTSNFIRQARTGYTPPPLDLLDELLQTSKIYITPHYYLSDGGHLEANGVGTRWVRGNTLLRYQAAPWTGALAKILPSNFATYLPSLNTSQFGFAVPIWGRLRRVYDNDATDGYWVQPMSWSDSYLAFPVGDVRRSYQKLQATSPPMINGGDSGSPMWMVINGTLVFVGHVAYLGLMGYVSTYTSFLNSSATNLKQYIDAMILSIEAEMGYAATLETVSEVSMVGFTAY